MDELEEAREEALDRLADLYGSNRITLREFEDRREVIVNARDMHALQAARENPPSPPAARTSGGTAVCIMGDRRINGDWLDQGRLDSTCIMGDLKVDLRGYSIPEGVVINTTTIMGDTVILLPRNVRVRNEISAILADVKEKGHPEAGGPEVIIKGIALMGDVKIRRE